MDDNISTLLKDLIKSRRNGFMDGKMKVAVMNGIGKMGFEERDIPTPKADEVLVKLESAVPIFIIMRQGQSEIMWLSRHLY